MDVLIRDAVDADASLIAQLLTQLGYPSTVEDAATRIAEWREGPLSRVVVATLDGRVVGVLALHAIPFFERPGRRGRVVSLVVDEEARGRATVSGDPELTTAITALLAVVAQATALMICFRLCDAGGPVRSMVRAGRGIG